MWKLFQLAIVLGVMWECQQLGISQGNEPADVLLGFIAAAAATALLSDAIDLVRRFRKQRNVPTPSGGPWHAQTVIRVQRRLEEK